MFDQMIRAGRAAEATEVLTSEESPVRLVSETWWISIGSGRRGLAFTYHRPRRVHWQDKSTGVFDHMVITRLLAAAAILLSVSVRRRSK